ncbi:MAG: glutamine synthetase beta-grasp domain-containing protein [Candidatus Bathyarchaeia archaeon]
MQDFTREDTIKLVQEKNIKIVNLCHIPEDCRLKTLSFTVRNIERLDEILEFGERVDGSSLFSFIDPNKSDIYIMPKTETAFIDLFSPMPTLNILCSYFDEDGKPLEIAPENILLKAEEKLLSSTGLVIEILAELELYMIYPQEESVFQESSDNNYHESMPFAKLGNLRNEILTTLEDVGVPTKYGHSEVGRFQSQRGYTLEQHEVEFLPQNMRRLAEAITIAKWVIRNICRKRGLLVSFAPKLALEHAGNGMHLHLCGLRKNENVIASSEGHLTDEAKQIIGGILRFAPSLAAFGNTIPPSYLRFISRKESPMHICWGVKNRLALLRIPLWWKFRKDFQEANSCRRTLEYRAPDPSADSYLLFAGIAIAAEYGLRNPKKAMKIAEDVNIDKKSRTTKKHKVLPLSCSEAANNLKRDRKYYETNGVFPKRVIDGVISKLESYNDKGLWKKLEKTKKVEDFLWKYLHYG